eukprot:CAMPEP_0179491772 /NCGR_PEP_ID=MMETSP0799-20121207/66308_1 /TAXON_ID=46947 /ORGANISM="Geminigera cryophila, Strain CCMP2564" /LENGTH=65 /DNA_ID=CAMNT_0021308329 /DNA_START=27 /DNA_END=221 /DNA_ORIENTATION=+
MILSAQLSNDGQHESDEDDEDELMKHMTFEERIAHIKHRTRPEMSSEDWTRRNVCALNLDECLGP